MCVVATAGARVREVLAGTPLDDGASRLPPTPLAANISPVGTAPTIKTSAVPLVIKLSRRSQWRAFSPPAPPQRESTRPCFLKGFDNAANSSFAFLNFLVRPHIHWRWFVPFSIRTFLGLYEAGTSRGGSVAPSGGWFLYSASPSGI